MRHVPALERGWRGYKGQDSGFPGTTVGNENDGVVISLKDP